MSGICGIVNFDGSPVDPEVLRKMTEAVAYRGPDGIHYWIEGNVGFAHLALHSTPEALREHQPLVNRRGDLVLTADARVDNRPELISTLTAKGYIQDKDPTDADLILAAYDCWGEACPEHIIGDFAFAVWDKRERKLFCARDAVGIRLLHYRQIDNTLLFATSTKSLRIVDPYPAINLALLDDLLIGRFDRWMNESAHQTIFRLPPSYCLTSVDSTPSLHRYWTFGERQVTYRRDQEYIDHFRDLFEDAVRVRLRTNDPIGILMSGGLDSTSVSCMTNHLLSSGHTCPPVNVYSAVFPNIPTADEKPYIEAVLNTTPYLKGNLIDCEDCWGLREFGGDNGYPLDEPDIGVDRSLTLKLLRQLRQDGCRVILWGEGADNILIGGPYFHPELVADVEFKHILRELTYFSRHSGKSIGYLLGYRLRSLVPTKIRMYLKRLLYSWLLHKPHNGSGDYKYDFLPPPKLRSRSSYHSYYHTTKAQYSARLVSFDASTAYIGGERRFPFFDRRLVDFTFSLPPRLRFQQGFRKYILREATKDLLPEMVYQRVKGTHFSDLNNVGLYEKEQMRAKALLEAPQSTRLNLENANSVSNIRNVYMQNPNRCPRRTLANTLCVEAWLDYHNR